MILPDELGIWHVKNHMEIIFIQEINHLKSISNLKYTHNRLILIQGKLIIRLSCFNSTVTVESGISTSASPHSSSSRILRICRRWPVSWMGYQAELVLQSASPFTRWVGPIELIDLGPGMGLLGLSGNWAYQYWSIRGQNNRFQVTSVVPVITDSDTDRRRHSLTEGWQMANKWLTDSDTRCQRNDRGLINGWEMGTLADRGLTDG